MRPRERAHTSADLLGLWLAAPAGLKLAIAVGEAFAKFGAGWREGKGRREGGGRDFGGFGEGLALTGELRENQ